MREPAVEPEDCSHRCAAWARAVELEPVGTAPRTDVFVLVEHPLPWPSDVLDDPLLAAVAGAAQEAVPGRTVRVQALVTEPSTVARRIVVFAAGDGPFRGYGRLEGVGEPEALPVLAAALVATPAPDPVDRVTDVLVCTHGTPVADRWAPASGGTPRPTGPASGAPRTREVTASRRRR